MTDTNKPPLALLIDGNNLAMPYLHTVGADRVRSSVERIVDAMVRKWSPAEAIACFDPPGRTWRHDLMDGYKAGRPRHPDADRAIDAAKIAMADGDVTVEEYAGFEADDAIATHTAAAVRDGMQVVIVSGDKDLHQCLSDGEVAQAVDVKRDGDRVGVKWVNAAEVVRKYGVRPGQWVDYRVMVGDPSDGIRGIEGIGPVAAAAVLSAFGSLGAFYGDAWKVQTSLTEAAERRVRTKLFNAKPHVPALRELLTLRRDVPIGAGVVA